MSELMITGAAALPATFEEAVLELQKLESEARATLSSIRDRQKDLIRQRFRQGRIVNAVTDEAEYGDGAVGRLAAATGISETTLYECQRFYLLPDFSQSISQLEKWIENTEERKGTVNWTYCRNLVHKVLDRKSPEAARANLAKQAQSIEKRAERLEHDAEDIARHAEILPVEEEQRDEIRGVAAKVREVAEDTRRQLVGIQGAPAKPVRYVDDAYRAFVAEHRCLACDAHPADPAHIEGSGWATKAPDWFCVPLCRIHHQEFDTRRKEFLAMYEITLVDLWRTVALLNIEYAYGVRLTET